MGSQYLLGPLQVKIRQYKNRTHVCITSGTAYKSKSAEQGFWLVGLLYHSFDNLWPIFSPYTEKEQDEKDFLSDDISIDDDLQDWTCIPEKLTKLFDFLTDVASTVSETASGNSPEVVIPLLKDNVKEQFEIIVTTPDSNWEQKTDSNGEPYNYFHLFAFA